MEERSYGVTCSSSTAHRNLVFYVFVRVADGCEAVFERERLQAVRLASITACERAPCMSMTRRPTDLGGRQSVLW